MSEELQNKIVEYLQKTESFIASEAPAFIQEALNFYFYKELIFLILSIVGCAVFLLMMIFWWSKKFANLVEEIDRHAPKEMISLTFSLFTILVSVIPVSSFFCRLLGLIQICVAPKLYLIEKFTEVL